MPDASHTPSICACTRGCDSSLGVGGLLGSGEGVGEKQAPEAMIFSFFARAAFVWVGLGCVCSSRLGKQHFHHCLAFDRSPAIQDNLSRTLANRPPLAKISSCPRPPPPRRRPGPSRTTTISNAEGEGDDWGGQHGNDRSYPRSFWPRAAGPGRARTKWEQGRVGTKGWPLSDCAEDPKPCESSSAGMARYRLDQDQDARATPSSFTGQ